MIDTTQPKFRRWINVVSILWMADKITLIRRWKWNKIRGRIFDVAQYWYNVGVQHWNNAKSTLHNVFNVAQCPFNVVSTLIWYYFNIVSMWPERLLKLYWNQSGYGFAEILVSSGLLNEIISLREKCPNTDSFLVRIFPHSDWIRRNSSVRIRENMD